MKLELFDYVDVTCAPPHSTSEDRMKCCARIGGAPYLLARIDESHSFEESISRPHFTKIGPAREESMSFSSWRGADQKRREQTDIDGIACDDIDKKFLLGECRWGNKFDERSTLSILLSERDLQPKHREYWYECLLSNHSRKFPMWSILGASIGAFERVKKAVNSGSESQAPDRESDRRAFACFWLNAPAPQRRRIPLRYMQTKSSPLVVPDVHVDGILRHAKPFGRNRYGIFEFEDAALIQPLDDRLVLV